MAPEGIAVQIYHKGAVAYLQSPLLEESGLADHAFSTRLGGCSTGNLASLNTAFHTGDSPENVLENRRRFFEIFSYDHLKIVSATQVHGTGMALVDHSYSGEGALPESTRQKADALITTDPGLPLTAYSADCMLIYFISRQKSLVALAHAGWRGTLGGIGAKMVRYLDKLFGITPGFLQVALSPCVCRNCYLVNDEVAGQFQSAGWHDTTCLEKVETDLWKLDLRAINIEQLLRAGIKRDNLDGSSWCTACNRDLFYSYRRDRGKTGRMIGFIALKESGRL